MEKVEKRKPLSKNKPEDTSTDTALEKAGIAFSFFFFFCPYPSHYVMEKMEPKFQYEYANLKNKNAWLFPLKAYSNHYWERVMSKVGNAKLNTILFQSLEVKRSFRRVRNQTFHHEWIKHWFYFLLQDLNQPQAWQGMKGNRETLW